MKFSSKYSPGKKVSAAQYITELICEKNAHIHGTNLPPKFWKLQGWKEFYVAQIRIANLLLKKNPPMAIIKALRDDRTKKCFSLRSPKIKQIIEEYNGKKN